MSKFNVRFRKPGRDSGDPEFANIGIRAETSDEALGIAASEHPEVSPDDMSATEIRDFEVRHPNVLGTSGKPKEK